MGLMDIGGLLMGLVDREGLLAEMVDRGGLSVGLVDRRRLFYCTYLLMTYKLSSISKQTGK